jgi:hypothetical protein
VEDDIQKLLNDIPDTVPDSAWAVECIKLKMAMVQLNEKFNNLKQTVEDHMTREEKDREMLDKKLDTIIKLLGVMGVVTLILTIQVSTGYPLIEWFRGWF